MTTVAMDVFAEHKEVAIQLLNCIDQVTKVTDAGMIYDDEFVRLIIEMTCSFHEFDEWLCGTEDGQIFTHIYITAFDMNKGPNEVMMDI